MCFRVTEIPGRGTKKCAFIQRFSGSKLNSSTSRRARLTSSSPTRNQAYCSKTFHCSTVSGGGCSVLDVIVNKITRPVYCHLDCFGSAINRDSLDKCLTAIQPGSVH